MCQCLDLMCCHVVLCKFGSQNRVLVTVRLYFAQRPSSRCTFVRQLPIPRQPIMPFIEVTKNRKFIWYWDVLDYWVEKVRGLFECIIRDKGRCIHRGESQESTMHEWDLAGHQAYADDNGYEVVLLYEFGLYSKVDPMNTLLTCYFFPFQKIV